VPGFTTPDPLAEMHYNESPYSFCGNNPVNKVDLSGMDYINLNPDSDPDDNNDDLYSSFPDPGNATNSDGTRFYYHLGDVSKTPDEDNCVSIIPSSGSYEAYYNMFCPQGQDNSGTGGDNIVGDRTISNSVGGQVRASGRVEVMVMKHLIK